MPLMKNVNKKSSALALIFWCAIAIKKNKGKSEDVDNLSPTNCKDDKNDIEDKEKEK